MIIMRGMSYTLPWACAIQNRLHDMRSTSKQPVTASNKTNR